MGFIAAIGAAADAAVDVGVDVLSVAETAAVTSTVDASLATIADVGADISAAAATTGLTAAETGAITSGVDASLSGFADVGAAIDSGAASAANVADAAIGAESFGATPSATAALGGETALPGEAATASSVGAAAPTAGASALPAAGGVASPIEALGGVGPGVFDSAGDVLPATSSLTSGGAIPGISTDFTAGGADIFGGGGQLSGGFATSADLTAAPYGSGLDTFLPSSADTLTPEDIAAAPYQGPGAISVPDTFSNDFGAFPDSTASDVPSATSGAGPFETPGTPEYQAAGPLPGGQEFSDVYLSPQQTITGEFNQLPDPGSTLDQESLVNAYTANLPASTTTDVAGPFETPGTPEYAAGGPGGYDVTATGGSPFGPGWSFSNAQFNAIDAQNAAINSLGGQTAATSPISAEAPTLGPGATPGAPTNISPAASTAAAPGGAAATSGLSSLFTAKNLPLLLGAGGLAYVLARGEQSLPPQAVQAEQQATELNALGLQELATAQNNQITPQQAAAIQINQQQQIAQAYQQVASMGQDPQNSSTYLSMVQQINNNALAEQVAYIQQNINTALTETGQANSDLLAVAQIQVQEDEDFQQALTTALSSFGLIAALSGINAAKAA